MEMVVNFLKAYCICVSIRWEFLPDLLYQKGESHLTIMHEVKYFPYRHFLENWKLWMEVTLYADKYSYITDLKGW